MTEEGPAPVDLEKELTCSICTDLLYQPLTLLDCLHTFCGACLKEWFAFQASTATSLHPYTCPSCRASVRLTQPNATVTTLLDMFIQANPERGKSEEDKKADREKFKYGDNVLPKLRRRGRGEVDEEERRVLEDVQALSLREVGIGTGEGSNYLEPPRERRRRERSQDGGRSRSSDTRRSRDEGRSRSRNSPAVSASREAVPPRVIEHQSSLRSLLSASELDSQEMEEEIMRQIMEDGLLDGIDLNNIDIAQEDEISERIAQAYRQRQAQRQRERRERRERLAREGHINAGYSTPPDIRSPPARDDDQQRRRPHGRSESGTSTPRERERGNRPPISRPGLLDVANQGAQTRHARSSSQGSSRSTRSELRPAPLNVSSRQSSSVSQTDLTTRSASAVPDRPHPARRRQSDNQQHSTLAERQQFRNNLQAHSSSNPSSPRRIAFHIPTTESPTSAVAVVASPLSSPPASASESTSNSRRTTDPAGSRQLRRTVNGTPPMANPPTFPRASTDPSAMEAQARSTPTTVTPIPPPTLYPEPHVSCSSCRKDHIEHDLHFNCSRCDEGTYNLCQPCYRSGKGCKHWFGFGWAAWPLYQKRAPPGGYPPSYEYPHIFRGHRYRRPQGQLAESPTTPGTLVSEEDPSHRLEEGVFCDICSSWANACYWKCDYCNEGEWGYCNDCVNQGRHCTHPLIPLTHISKEQRTPPETSVSTDAPSTPRTTHLNPPYPDDSPPTTPPLTPKSASLTRGPGHVSLVNSVYRPLTFTVLCNICTYPIPPSHTRFHCSQCNDGDYDICSSCYKKLVLVGKISEGNGMNGWRRCLRGHRMIVVGFEDRDGGQRRIVVRNLVGGLSLREEEVASPPTNESSTPTTSTQTQAQREEKWTWREHDGSRHHSPSTSTSPHALQPQRRYPPDGGVGLRVQARWGYFPAADAEDELSFPKFAELTEAEDINGDWFWGVYAGSKGLFPGGYGRVIGGSGERQGLI
ncbi:hypothetical protein CC80DRAFT_531664 [Byssothecium circinans]|uniref:RING-type domain-containing protein n=1 Tax=Byssothecium circinans TaxID=147558 RepID=A0A6A5UAF9_9PLEO|nr:hypothetical protein CC80DRAFT_531664 [Byssothecium circinans]